MAVLVLIAGTGTIVVLKVAVSNTVEFFFKNEIGIETGESVGNAKTFLQAIIQSDPVVDCSLIFFSLVAFVVSAVLVFVARGRSMEAHPVDVKWDQLRTTTGCKEYLISEIEDDDPKMLAVMKELLRECLIRHPGNLRVIEDHPLGKRRARRALLRALGKFRVVFSDLYETHGNLLKSLEKIKTEVTNIDNFVLPNQPR